ncbi:Six-bladed beta-propeller, TolB-like [Sergentomyia squamirostris]
MESVIRVIALCVIVILVQISVINSVPRSEVQQIYQWNKFVFTDLPHSEKSDAGGYSYYDANVNRPTAYSYHPATNCMFISFPRRFPGIPVTVAFGKATKYKNAPYLEGYPTYKDNYVPGWFGVNDLEDDDYKNNIYPDDSHRQKREDSDDDDDDITKKHHHGSGHYGGEYYKPSHSNSHHKPSYSPKPIYYPPPPTQPPYTKPPYTHPPYTKPPYTQPPYTKPPYTQPPYTKPPYTQPPYTKPPYTKPPYTRPPHTKPPATKPPSRDSYHFISVFYNLLHNACSRLFFVDTGILEYPEGNIICRRPVIWAFDINTCDSSTLDQSPALKVTVPDKVYNYGGGLLSMAIDVYGTCNEFALYISNPVDERIVVYDNVKRTFWYFSHQTFKPYAENDYLYAHYQATDSFNLGVLGIVLGGINKYNYRTVYYLPLSSVALFDVSTKILRDKSLAPGDFSSSDFSFIGYRGKLNALTMTFDDTSQVLFFIHALSPSVSCWNTNTELTKDNVVTLFSDDNVKHGVDFFIDDERELWIFMSDTIYGITGDDALLENPVDYRLYRGNIDDMIHGTACDYTRK